MREPELCADVVAAGVVKGGRAVVFLERGGTVELSPEQARMVQLVDSFRSTDDHARAVCRGLSLPEDYSEEVVEMLGELVELGVMTTSDVLHERLARGPAGRREPIEDVAIPTRERPGQLVRCIDSVAADARQLGRAITVRVFDDARAPSAAAATFDALAAIDHDAVHLRYANQEDKRRFSAELASCVGTDPDVVAFGLADPLGIGLTIGANRNAALLDLAGRSFVFLDDDMECRAALAVGGTPGARLARYPSAETLYYGTPSAAIDAASFSDQSLIATLDHELGRSLAELARSEQLHVGGVQGSLARRLVRAGGLVEVVACGYVGDSGGLPESALFPPRREGPHPLGFFERGEPPVGRGVDRGVMQLTLATDSGLMTGACALQNRDLPPFPPVLRNEDGAFAVVFNALAPTGLIAHVPARAVHRPEGRDGLALERDGRMPSLAHMGANSYLQRCVGALASGMTALDRPARLRALGRRVRELGNWAPADLRELLLPLAVGEVADRLNRLEESRAFWIERDAPPAWRTLTRRYLDQLHGDLAAGAFVVPIELMPEGSAEPGAAFARLQVYLREYGRLLEAWPALTTAAADLAERGVSLTRAVR